VNLFTNRISKLLSDSIGKIVNMIVVEFTTRQIIPESQEALPRRQNITIKLDFHSVAPIADFALRLRRFGSWEEKYMSHCSS
jgi:hypothetical protein